MKWPSTTCAFLKGKDVEAIVTDCAACGMRTEDVSGDHVQKSGNCRESRGLFAKIRGRFGVSRFRSSVRRSSLGQIPETVCFHDPCHLRHGQKLVLPQRDLLRRIPNLTLKDIPDDGQCCGSAGIYNITHRERSMKILEAKITAIGDTSPDRVITSNPGCFMQLVYGRKRWNQKWGVLHISQILSESLKRGERTK